MSLHTAIRKRIPVLSIIVAVDLARRARDLVRRVRRIIATPGMEAFEIVVAHNNRGGRYDRHLVNLVAGVSHVRLVSEVFYGGQVNVGLLRNRAVDHATAPLVMLLDADLYPDPALFNDASRRLMRGEDNMLMLPCLYLTHWASSRLLDGRLSVEAIIDGYFSFDRRYFLHLASPSSLLVLRRADYFRIGGFDEGFCGHGYEDFDFMTRLALRFGLIPMCGELLENRTYRAPLLAEGFRKHLGRISLPWLIERKIILHLHHGKPSVDQYYAARKVNAEKFISKMRCLFPADVSDEGIRPDLLINDFFRICQEKKIAARDYFVLFDVRPGHVDRMSRWIDRLKFVFGHR